VTESRFRWRKSSYSGGADECVEIAFTPDNEAAIRDSKNADGPILAFDSRALDALVARC
jgi:hypothetical protein